MREEDESNIRGGWTDMDLYNPKPPAASAGSPIYTAGICKVGGNDSYVVGFLETKHIVAITGRVGGGNDEASQKDAIRIATLLNACKDFSTDDFTAGRVAIRKWVSCADQLPDSDTTVLTYQPGCNEPVWGGYHDGESWRNIDGPVTAGVIDWMEFPDPP